MTEGDTANRAEQPGDGVPCRGCGSLTDRTWTHCATCGLASSIDAGPEREHLVTVLVSDLQGSTALAERLDPESLRLVLDRYFDELGAVLEAHGGRIEKRIGDMMVTVFGLPQAAPDDAWRALAAAVESQQALHQLNDRLEAGWGVRLTNRVGVATGAVVYATPGGAHRVLAGEALEGAGALEPLAPPFEVLVAASTVDAIGARARFGSEEELVARSGAVVRARQLVDVDDLPAEALAGSGGDDAHCAACGAELVATSLDGVPAAWCTSCGAPRPSDRVRHERRRTLTIVFADLHVGPVAATGGVEVDVDERTLRTGTLRAFDAVRRALERHGGTVEHFIGDAVMAVFGLERRNEDDALRAVRAGLESLDELAALADDLAAELGLAAWARIGINTGPVITGDPKAGERLVTGDAVNVAARLEQTARPGDVVIGDLTRRLAGPGVIHEAIEPLVLKGKAAPVAAFRVSGVRDSGAARAAFELPMLGRDAALQHLLDEYRVASTGSWRRVRVRGDAGIGKSRLVHEALDTVRREATVLRGSCLPYGEGITFWPLAEVVRAASRAPADPDGARAAIERVAPDREVAVRLQALAGLDDRPVPVTELGFAVRRLLEHLASERPVVVVIDGLQWAEPTLVDLLDDLAGTGTRAPVLLVTMERPDAVAAEAADRAGADDVDLAPLDDTTCHELIVRALGPDAVPLALRQRIVGASAGVPLFIEQLLTMLVDDGRLVSDRSGWRMTVPVDDLEIPPTVEAVLAARVDALAPAETAVVEPASVVGREFAVGAVRELAGAPVEAEVLASLDQRQLVAPMPVTDGFADHRFRNQLLRDVVYQGLLKRTRAVMHEQFADWLHRGPGAGRLTEIEEILGFHLEQSYVLHREVAAIDDHVAHLGERASTHLSSSGERAFARGDMPAASNLLFRAAATIPGGGVRRSQLLVAAGDAAFETGDLAAAIARYGTAEQVGVEASDDAAAGAAVLARTTVGYLTGDGVDDALAAETVERLLPVFERAGDVASTARCWRLRTYQHMFACRWGDAERAAISAIEHAQRAGDDVLERRVRPALAGFALYGPTPVPAALALCDELLSDAGDDRRARSLVQQFAGHLHALRGDVDEARRRCLEARADLLELGWNFDAAIVSIHLGPVELIAGRPEVAESLLRADAATLTAMGERNYLATTTALLAEAVRRQGRVDEAAALVEEAASLAADDDVFTQVGWRRTRAQCRLAEGRVDAAATDLAGAMALVASTDGPYATGEVLLDRAALLLATGDCDGARADASEARRRFEAKGATIAAAAAAAAVAAAG